MGDVTLRLVVTLFSWRQRSSLATAWKTVKYKNNEFLTRFGPTLFFYSPKREIAQADSEIKKYEFMRKRRRKYNDMSVLVAWLIFLVSSVKFRLGQL